MLKNVTINFDELSAIVGTNKTTLEQNKAFNAQINETNYSLIKEAVKHFSKRFRPADEDDFDERYFYHKEEIDLFFELNKNPNVKVREEYDNKNPKEIYCYILYR